jgi:ParB family chromosome partitioning protein
MEFRKIVVEDLIPAEYNPRKKLKAGDKEFEAIRQSIAEFGYSNPIVINSDMTIISGHQRYSVLKSLGYAEVDCVIVDLNKTHEKAVNIALNKITGEWNLDSLADLLKELQVADLNLDATGFTADEVTDLFAKTQKSVAVDDNFDIKAARKLPTITESGDVWELGRHRLVVGDSFESGNYEMLMQGEKANACVSAIDSDDNENTLKNAYANIVDGGVIYIIHSDEQITKVYADLKNAGFHISTTCIWCKNKPKKSVADYCNQYTPITYAIKNTAKHKWYSDRKQTTVWNFEQRDVASNAFGVPIPVLAYAIKNNTAPNAIILDPNGGDGGVLIACEQLDRNARLIETNTNYASGIIRRFKAFNPEATIKRNGAIFDEI